MNRDVSNNTACADHNSLCGGDQSGHARGVLKKLALLLVGYGLLGGVSLSLLLPALGNMKDQDEKQRSTTQARGIVQSLFTYAGGNKERMPGLSSKGFILQDDGTDESLTGRSGHGATVEARFWILLDNNSFSGEYLISPAETKSVWTTGEVSSDNYSFALLNLHSKDEIALGNVRPDQTNRAREWRQTVNTQAILLADRARISGGKIGEDYDNIYSVHTSEEDAYWAGSIGRGDGSASFQFKDALDTKYGAAASIIADRLFAFDQDAAPNIDTHAFPDTPWQDNGNALLGYTSVGYEDDDIASD